MEQRFKIETDGLTRSWMRRDQRILRDYLVRDVEDPRINIQSILTRHFLIHRLFGDKFSPLMEQELRFALVVNRLLRLAKRSVDSWQSDVHIPEHLMNKFAAVWQKLLRREQPGDISVLEPACGSANDYRFIDSYGIARLLNYQGFDLCEKNIGNAQGMFPQTFFTVGNVLEIDTPDKAFDYCFVHDLFEHLSVEAMEMAISEICRVTRQAVCIGFFNMQVGDEHSVKTVGSYHWNRLSLARTKALFQKHARHTSGGRTAVVDAIHIDTFLMSRFGYSGYHNKNAYTLVVRM